MARVTVHIDDAMLARVQELAALQETTVDELLERLLRVAMMPTLGPDDLPPHTRAASGLLKDLPDRPYEDLLTEALIEKYGLDK